MDLYHPPCEPYNRWDLLTLHALAEAGRMDWLGLVGDYPLLADEIGERPNGWVSWRVTLARMRMLMERDISWTDRSDDTEVLYDFVPGGSEE